MLTDPKTQEDLAMMLSPFRLVGAIFYSIIHPERMQESDNAIESYGCPKGNIGV
jgi:hypothetical protein